MLSLLPVRCEMTPGVKFELQHQSIRIEAFLRCSVVKSSAGPGIELDGNHVAIAILVGDSKAGPAMRAGVIAKIAKAVFDKWSGVKPTDPLKTANFNERHSLN